MRQLSGSAGAAGLRSSRRRWHCTGVASSYLLSAEVELPSNLQGLYEVGYVGDQLDHDATMKLLELFNDFR
jgi:hypothetical protein